ncbi:MAG: biopolymer transporter ExbD [Planctomycetota bacterium]
MRLSTRYQRRNQKLELSMTSMIDVVFLLLIFFLVTTTFVRPERQLNPGIKVEERSADDAASNEDPVIIDVVRQGELVLFQLEALRTNDLEEISRALEVFSDEVKQQGAFIRVAADVPFEPVAQAIGACKANGFKGVHYVPIGE